MDFHNTGNPWPLKMETPQCKEPGNDLWRYFNLYKQVKLTFFWVLDTCEGQAVSFLEECEKLIHAVMSLHWASFNSLYLDGRLLLLGWLQLVQKCSYPTYLAYASRPTYRLYWLPYTEFQSGLRLILRFYCMGLYFLTSLMF